MTGWIYNLIYSAKDAEIEILKAQLPVVNPLEEYYNNKYPKSNPTYRRTDKNGTISIDVRQFLNPNNFFLQTFSGTEDERTLQCLKWIITNITYTPDKTEYGLDEYWAFGYETLNNTKGDCEDGAILLYDLLRHNNIPDWKVRVTAGSVINPNTNIMEGHCYITYFCEETEKWVLLDWCYLPTKEGINKRGDYKENVIYRDVWFSFNEKYAWGQNIEI